MQPRWSFQPEMLCGSVTFIQMGSIYCAAFTLLVVKEVVDIRATLFLSENYRWLVANK